MSKCYTCRFKGTVPGSVHSSCTAITNIQKQIQCMRAIFQQGYVQMKVNGEETLRKVSFNYHGIVKGWANWPLDFDPAWLTQCDLFLSKTHPYMNQNHTSQRD